METLEDKSRREELFERAEEAASGIKQKLGSFGRRIKRIDLRSQIVDHSFAAVGIAAGVGALIGLARPMPKRGPLSGALMALISTIGFRLVREAAMVQLAQYARGVLGHDEDSDMQTSVSQPSY